MYNKLPLEYFTYSLNEGVNISNIARLFKKGRLLAHVRTPSEDVIIGSVIYPSAGIRLRSTESWQFAEEEYGSGPELIFLSDKITWMSPGTDVVFIKKNPTIQQSLGNGKVKLFDGSVVSYSRSPMADYENPNFKEEPCGVEQGDWYTKEPQEIVAIIPSQEFLKVINNV